VSGIPESRLRLVLAWAVIALTAGPVGVAVVLGIAFGESPCILCWTQRTSMVLMALAGLLVLRYGPRPRYLGAVVLLGAGGVYMALRHSALHLVRDVGQGFAASFFGAHTYVWSWFIHWVVLLVLAALLLLLREDTVERGTRPLGRVGGFALGLFLVVVGANAVQAFVSTGPPPFIGQSDPVRFSWNPSRWVWMKPERIFGPVSLRGAWDVPRPGPALLEVDADPAAGPLTGLPVLPVLGRETVGAELNGLVTDLARDPATGRFLVVTHRHGVYVLDPSLSTVEHRVVLDPFFAADIGALAGAAFMGDTLVVGTVNKSHLLLRPDAEADEAFEWRHFLETSGGVRELRRSRFATVRARQQYVLSLAFDEGARELVTVSVSSPRHRHLVVSRFDASDFTLSSEFVPRLGPGMTLRDGRSLADYVITGAVAMEGTLYAISAAYSTLLAIDLATRTLEGAWAVPGLEHPVGVAARGDELLVVQADGRIAVLARPGVGVVEPA
jgi:disulfide bond formation protein DsbB